MERPRASDTLHELLLEAVERAAHVQDESAALLKQQRDAVQALNETLDRGARRKRAYGNRHRDARRRSRPG